jgi:hypothetical protein
MRHDSALRATLPPTFAKQICSQDRGVRLKQLAQLSRSELLSAASTLWEAARKRQPQHICRIDGSDNLLARLAARVGPFPMAGRRMGQATLYLPAAWPTRAAAVKRGRRLAMSAIGNRQELTVRP